MEATERGLSHNKKLLINLLYLSITASELD